MSAIRSPSGHQPAKKAPSLVVNYPFYQRKRERNFCIWTHLDFFTYVLSTFASSGPYGPFLAIHRAFYNKMSVGKCLVGKCLVGKCHIGTCHQVRESSSSFLLNGWTECKGFLIFSDFFRHGAPALTSPAASTPKLCTSITSPRGHVKWSLAYQATPQYQTHQSHTLDPIWKLPRSQFAKAIRLLINDTIKL